MWHCFIEGLRRFRMSKNSTTSKVFRRERKKVQNLKRKHKSQSKRNDEAFMGVVARIMFYFIRSIAARGIIFFFVCILITLYNNNYKM